MNFLFVKKAEFPTLAVFVHGFRGDVKSSWESLIPLMEGDDKFSADVALWGYPSGVFKRTPSVWQAAEQLQTELRVRAPDYDAIVLIGHSLGGLLVRALVVAALKEGRFTDIERIAHIITLATPNDGQELAALLGRFSKQLADLAVTGDTVEEIRNEWINRVYTPVILAGEERYKHRIPLTAVIGLEDTLVSPESGKSFFRDPPPEVVPGNHMSMKVASSRDDTIYQLLRSKVLGANEVAAATVIESVNFLKDTEAAEQTRYALELVVDNTKNTKDSWLRTIKIGARVAQRQAGQAPFMMRVRFNVSMECDLRLGTAVVGRVTAGDDALAYRLEGSYEHKNGTPEKSYEVNLSFPAALKIPLGEKLQIRIVFAPPRKTVVEEEKKGRLIAATLFPAHEVRFWLEILTDAGVLRLETEDDSFLRFVVNEGEVLTDHTE